MNESMKRAKEIVEESKTASECIQKLSKEKLIVSFAEGRRLWDTKRAKPVSHKETENP